MTAFDLHTLAEQSARTAAERSARLERNREADRAWCRVAAARGEVVCGVCGSDTPPARCMACGADPAQQVQSCPECAGEEIPGPACDTCAGERVVETEFGHLYELSAGMLAERGGAS